jgi:hypothetical protein
LRIKVRIAPTTVDGTVTDPDISQIGRAIVPDRDVARPVNHPVVAEKPRQEHSPVYDFKTEVRVNMSF